MATGTKDCALVSLEEAEPGVDVALVPQLSLYTGVGT